MKSILAILALFGVLLVLPLSAVALTVPANNETRSGAAGQGIVVPVAGEEEGDVQDQQDSQGDPDELGGGFRNHGAPPCYTGVDPDGIIWIDPLFVLFLHIF